MTRYTMMVSGTQALLCWQASENDYKSMALIIGPTTNGECDWFHGQALDISIITAKCAPQKYDIYLASPQKIPAPNVAKLTRKLDVSIWKRIYFIFSWLTTPVLPVNTVHGDILLKLLMQQH